MRDVDPVQGYVGSLPAENVDAGDGIRIKDERDEKRELDQRLDKKKKCQKQVTKDVRINRIM